MRLESGYAHTRLQMLWVALMDMACLAMGSTVAVLLRFGPDEMRRYVFGHLDGWLLFFGSVLLANYLNGSYRIQNTFSRFNLVVTWFFSLVFALFILSVTTYAWFRIVLGRGVLVLSIALYSTLSLSLKLLVYRTLFHSEVFLCRTAILGAGRRAAELRRAVENEFVMPVHKVVACIRTGNAEAPTPNSALVDGVIVLDAPFAQLEEVIRSLDCDLLLVGLNDFERAREFYPLLKRLRYHGIEVLTPLQVAEIYTGRIPLDMLSEEFLLQTTLESGLPVIQRVKRLFDILVSFTALVLLWPLMLLIAAVIKAAEPRSPVLYTQTRLGRFNEPFRIVKFRTMRAQAEDETGPVWSANADERITPAGRCLRRFRLDELPQLFNILRGEMSVVGPRPERPELAARLEAAVPFYAERVNVMPGLTGWAQIHYPYGNSVEDAARKLEYDLYYIRHLSIALDLQIILSTLRIVVLGMEREI